MMTPPVQPSHVTVRSVEAVKELRDELSRLAVLPAAASGIVQHPDWLLFEVAWRGDIMAPYLVVVRDGQGKLIGYAPMLTCVHHARIHFGNRYLQVYRGYALRLLGERVVAVPEHRSLVERLVADALLNDRQARVVRIQETILPNALAATMATGAQRFSAVQVNMLDQVNWSITPQASLADYLATLGSKKRNDLSRRVRNVYKKLGEQTRLRVFETPESIDEYAALMKQLYARSWHATEQPIDWTLPARLALFRQLAQDGRFLAHVLMQGERPVAYVHGYRLGGRYLLDDTGYDEAFASLGAGSALVFQAVQDVIARFPGETIDFGYGDNQYKRVLGNRQIACGSLYLVRGATPLARFGLIVPLRGLYRWVHGRMRREQAASAA
ncbi:MAG TPA: GNAT family N-acetyltransferase [Dyella sp.]|uniref:GNAT family N-acetyltransferase n=1 Tax=Dyella sp. TaxID=1869338 RepID=UPI002D76C870|nr:GNAT family N-acetyltransferase [Dyella sp.]HET6554398.1 GNAT family N-acetyltransferase [Dyella sp.]